MKVDFEIKGWERIDLEDSEHNLDILNAINAGEIQSGNQLVEYLEERYIEWELTPLIVESETYLGGIEVNDAPIKTKG